MEDGLTIQAIGGETRAFRFAEGRLADLGIWRARQPLPGDVYLARVARLDRPLGLAFCDMGEGPAGVLPLDQAPAGLSEGASLPVRLVRSAAPGKGPKLAPARGPARWKEGSAPRLLERAAEPLARFLDPPPETLQVDTPGQAADLRARGLAPQLHPGGFAPALANLLDGEVEGLLQPLVELPGGASLLIEPGETLTAIDVNMGAGGRGESAVAAEALNLSVLPEIARQLRLRALAGRIVIDCLALAGRDQRRRLRSAMERALAGDPERTRVLPMTAGGLLEVTRRRGLFAPLHELLTEPAGPFAGRRLTKKAEAIQVLRHLAALQRQAPGQRLVLRAEAGLFAELERMEDWQGLSKASGALLRIERIETPDGRGGRYLLWSEQDKASGGR